MVAVAPAAAALTTRPLLSMAKTSCRFMQALSPFSFWLYTTERG